MAGAIFYRIKKLKTGSRSASYAPEGAKRLYPKHWISKLTDADGFRLVELQLGE